MKQVLFAAALAVVATQGAALSCMRPDAVGTFNTLSGQREGYYILHGTLDFDASKQPQGVVNKERNPDPIAAHFEGFGLNAAGFTSRFDRDVVLQPVCFGPWCGTQVPGVTSLFFAKIVGEQIVISADPCGTTIFPEPPQSVLDAMTDCINGDCTPSR